jgi:hypothetical protein
MKRVAVLVFAAVLPACATVVEGTSDTVTVSTTPAGATCTIDRNGERVGAVPITPGSVRIDKSRHDLTVTCTKEGYQTASVTTSPTFTGTTFGNILVGGLVGVAVDIASGANNRYPSEVRLELAENPRPAAPPPPLATEPVENAPVRPVTHRRLRGPGI